MHKPMQTTRSLENRRAWPEIQVVGIAQYNLGFDLFFQVTLRNRLYTSDRTYRHKNRRFYFTVVGGYAACACT